MWDPEELLPDEDDEDDDAAGEEIGREVREEEETRLPAVESLSHPSSLPSSMKSVKVVVVVEREKQTE